MASSRRADEVRRSQTASCCVEHGRVVVLAAASFDLWRGRTSGCREKNGTLLAVATTAPAAHGAALHSSMMSSIFDIVAVPKLLSVIANGCAVPPPTPILVK